MKIFQLMLLLGFAFVFILILNQASAANTVAINYPNTTNVNRIGGTINLNASLDTNALNMTNMTFYRRANSHTGAWTVIGSVANTSAQQTLNWILSFDTTSIIDDRNHEFNVTGYNATGSPLTNALASNISIDNGVPTVTFASTSLSNLENRQSGQIFTISIDADSTIGIINCTIRFNAGNVFLPASANACSDAALTSTNFSLPTGVFTYNISAVDDNGNQTFSSNRQLSIAGGGQGSSTGGSSSSTTTTTPTTQTPSTSGPSMTVGQRISSFFSSIGNFFRNLFNRN